MGMHIISDGKANSPFRNSGKLKCMCISRQIKVVYLTPTCFYKERKTLECKNKFLTKYKVFMFNWTMCQLNN